MKRLSLETAVGIFVLIGIASIGYLTIKLGKMELIGGNHYIVDARFDSVSGLKIGASIEMSGVEIGKVDSIALDPEEQIAVVGLKILKAVDLTDDVVASVKTAGLIGDKYINITPGGSDTALKHGDEITETESVVDLEDLISKYVFGGT